MAVIIGASMIHIFIFRNVIRLNQNVAEGRSLLICRSSIPSPGCPTDPPVMWMPGIWRSFTHAWVLQLWFGITWPRMYVGKPCLLCVFVVLCVFIHIDGLMLERRNSSVLAMELRLTCINPSISVCPDVFAAYLVCRVLIVSRFFGVITVSLFCRLPLGPLTRFTNMGQHRFGHGWLTISIIFI